MRCGSLIRVGTETTFFIDTSFVSMGDRVSSGDVLEERYNCARVERALRAMAQNHEQRMERIDELEVRGVKSDELHRLRRAVVCYEFLLGVRERVPNMSDRPTHVTNRVSYYRKCYGGAVLGRRLAQSNPGHKGSKRHNELQKRIQKWRRENPDKYKHRNISLQACCSELRILVSGDRIHDFDMVNCFPTIGIYMTQTYGLQSCALRAYVSKDREGLLLEIMGTYKVDRKVAKTLPLTILHGGSIDSWKAKNHIRTSKNVLLMVELESEATQLRVAALQSTLPLEKSVLQSREFLRTVRGKSDHGEFGSTEVDRSLFSLIMQTREDRILETMTEHCQTRGVTVESLQFDGLLVSCSPTLNVDGFLRELEAVIESNCGVPMKLVEKELYRMPHQPIIDEIARV